MIDPQYLPLLVTGASGNLGRLIMSELLNVYKVPANQLIATSRNPSSLTEFAQLGVTTRYADFDKPETLPEAFSGATRLLMISTTPEMPYIHGKRFIQQSAAINAAIKAGVEHVLYTSAPNPHPGSPAFWKEDHYKTEQALINSGLKWTILRHWEWPDWHLEETWMRAIETGQYLDATDGASVNHVTREDCAKADAGALVYSRSVNRRFDVTGNQPHTAQKIMSMLSSITSKPIEVTQGSIEEMEQSLLANGKTTELAVPIFGAYMRAVQRGLYGGTSDAIEELTGKKPSTLQDYLVKTLTK